MKNRYFYLVSVFSIFGILFDSSKGISQQHAKFSGKMLTKGLLQKLGSPRGESGVAKLYQDFSSQHYTARQKHEVIVGIYSEFTKGSYPQENLLRNQIHQFIKLMIQDDPKAFAEILLVPIQAKLAKDPHPPMDISFLLRNYSKELQETVLFHLDRELQKPQYRLYSGLAREIRMSLQTSTLHSDL